MHYPNSSIDKQKVIKNFLAHGYSLILDTAGTASGVYGATSFSGDLVFVKTWPLLLPILRSIALINYCDSYK
jgi:hypothetical protein